MNVHRTQDGKLIIKVDPQLVISNAQELKSHVGKALLDNHMDIVLDFSDTQYIDSKGKGVCISVSKMVRLQGGRITLLNLDERTVEDFRLFHLNRCVKAFDRNGNDLAPSE